MGFDLYWISLISLLSLSKDARWCGLWFDRLTMSG